MSDGNCTCAHFNQQSAFHENRAQLDSSSAAQVKHLTKKEQAMMQQLSQDASSADKLVASFMFTGLLWLYLR